MPLLEALAGPDQSRFIGQQQRQAGAEGEAHRLDDDAGELGLGNGGDAADDQALQQGIDGGGDPGPDRFEDGHQGQDKAADGSHPTRGITAAGLPALKKMLQVQLAVRQTHSSKSRDLLVAPWMDMVSSVRAIRPRPEKVVD